ncbi:hypothetical protein [Ornithobacterium rhinotracheale]|uniref:hypothetical protein n=1 Tax=Ornithobacterium rhinotracheale TaxID=28251 RepID=UPI00129D19F7|nr:hypothetical protein [Ornithobacterium rhinotracheale]MRI64233.1 hypothetical protein [Ornithobacterium rhinotracheale]
MKKIISYYQKAKQWCIENPKKVYAYAMVLLGIFLIISIIQVFCPPKSEKRLNNMPLLFQKSDAVKQKIELTQQQKEEKIRLIIREIETFKEKKDKGQLTKEDSLRIDYLYNQYQKIQNEK